jgi:hypothetical protein
MLSREYPDTHTGMEETHILSVFIGMAVLQRMRTAFGPMTEMLTEGHV